MVINSDMEAAGLLKAINYFELAWIFIQSESAFAVCLCYNSTMKQKPLIETNPYLRDPEKLRKLLITNVSSSTAIETGASVDSIACMLEETKNTAPLKTTQRSSR
jgi:hypothetical protein